MTSAAFEPMSTERKLVSTRIRIQGAGTSDPTELLGVGVAVTRVSAVGKYRVTWTDNPGTFAGVGGVSFQATTPSDLAGYSVAFGDYTASGSSYTLDFWVYDASNTLDDLESGWKLTFDADFKRARP